MRQLTLREHRLHEAAPLNAVEVSSLQALVPDLSVSLSRSEGYDIKTGSTVGAVRVGDLAVEIRPKLPIRRFLFLLSYSRTPDLWRQTEFPYRGHPTFVEALAYGFVQFCRRAVSQGLLRGYRERNESEQQVRGRIRFDAQVKKRFGRAPPVEVTYDEFTEDIAENRMLAAAVEVLGRLHLRSRDLQIGLRSLRAAFQGVTLVDYRRNPLPEIRYSRLNEHYRPALRLGRLILKGSAIQARTGGISSAAFLLDMNDLFEDFVVVALREALGLSEYAFPQQAKGRSFKLDEAGSVGLEPDLSWWKDGRCIFVGDVKYKQVHASGIKHPDLYQLLAYTVAAGLPSGMLLYAEGEPGTTRHTVRRLGKELEVRRLDLTEPPEVILAQIDGFAAEIRDRVASVEESPMRLAAI